MNAKCKVILFLSTFLLSVRGETQSFANFDVTSPLNREALAEKIRGSYGFLSNREPSLDEGEYAIIEQFLPFLEDDPEFALDMIEGLTANNRGLSAAFDFVLGNLYFQSNEEEKALIAYQKAILKYPDYLRAWRALGWLFLYQSNYPAALEAFGKAIRLGDTQPDTFGQIGFCFYIQEDYISSLSAYTQALLYEPNSKQWMEGKLASMIALGNYESAKVILESLTRQYPNNHEFWSVLSNTYIRLEQPENAAASLEFLRDLGDPTQEAMTMLSGIYMSLDSYLLAGNIMLEMLENGFVPQSGEVLRCANKLLENEQPELANRLMDAYRHSPDNLTDDERISLYLFEAKKQEALGNVEDANEMLQKALKLSPNDGEILVHLGVSQFLNEDYEAAQITLTKAESQPNSRLNAILAQAQMLIHLEFYEEAAAKLEIAISEGAGFSAQKLYQDCIHAARRMEIHRISTPQTSN